MIKIVIGRKNSKINTTKELMKKCKNNAAHLDCSACKYSNSKECPFYRFIE